MRKIYFILIFTGVMGCVSAPHDASKKQEKEDSSIQVNSTENTIAYSVVDIETGEVLTVKNEKKLLPPASVEKAFIAAYALKSLGPDFRFHTRLVRQGKKFFLVGGGDPSLTLRNIFEIAQKTLAKGIRVIREFHYDDSYFPSAEVISEGMRNSAPYNAGVSSLNVEYNQALVQLDLIHSPMPPLPVVSEAVKRLYPEPWTHEPGVSRIPIREGARFTAELFAWVFKLLGGEISVPSSAQASHAIAVADHESGPLIGIVTTMLEYSNNLFAEALALTASRVRLKRPISSADSMNELQSWLTHGFGLEKSELRNNSGLSVESRVSAQALTHFLRKIDKTYWAGHNLRSLFNNYGWQWKKTARFSHPDTALRVFAKSGSLDFVSNLAGYLYTKSGKKLAFSILCSNTAAHERTRALSEDEKSKLNYQWLEPVSKLQQEILNNWVNEDYAITVEAY